VTLVRFSSGAVVALGGGGGSGGGTTIGWPLGVWEGIGGGGGLEITERVHTVEFQVRVN